MDWFLGAQDPRGETMILESSLGLVSEDLVLAIRRLCLNLLLDRFLH